MMASMAKTSSGRSDRAPKQQRLPNPSELHAFLTKHYAVPFLDPSQPAPFFPALRIVERPFQDEYVQELRSHCRNRLLDKRDQWRGSRWTHLKKPVAATKPPTSNDLFQIAGAHVRSHQRILTSMRMVGIAKGDLKRAATASKFSEYLNGNSSPNYSSLPNLCAFLGIHPIWGQRGPQAYTPVLDDGVSPWWLAPWRLACREAFRFFDAVERNGMLQWRPDADAFDFEGFWSTWQAHPEVLSMQEPKVGQARSMVDGVTLAKDPLPSLLPWLFCCRVGYKTGDPAMLNYEEQAAMQWILSYYQRHVLPAPLKKPLPPGQPPTGAEVLTLRERFLLPNLQAGVVTSPGKRNARLVSRFVASPEVLPSDVGWNKPGRKTKKLT